MLIIGCDYHPSFQQIAFMDTGTGEYGERRLDHMEGAGQFYRELRARGIEARIGMEASGYTRWFEQLTGELKTGGQTERSPRYFGAAPCVLFPALAQIASVEHLQ